MLFLCLFCTHWYPLESCPWPSSQFECSFWMISLLLGFNHGLCLEESQLYPGDTNLTPLAWAADTYAQLPMVHLHWMSPWKRSTPRSKLNWPYFLPPLPHFLFLLYPSFAWMYYLFPTLPRQKCRIHSWLLYSLPTPHPVNHQVLWYYYFKIILSFSFFSCLYPFALLNLGGWISASFLTGLPAPICILSPLPKICLLCPGFLTKLQI